MGFKFDLRDYLKFYNFLSNKECKELIKSLKKTEWTKHSYYDANADVETQYENELSVVSPLGGIFDLVNEKCWYSIRDYVENVNIPAFNCWHGYTKVRYNKYELGEEMRDHVDHISSIFDGRTKGVPVLTLLGNLNENYSGGKLIMFNEQEINMPTGSLVIFPSTFMYPHLVTPVTKGVRYSFVSWVW